mmetsp:Transcript_18382/g.42111  ORF Transcript_18382/g.42111 Transcript_18382/m.42111 type:complete len:558 (-) Transcript_18382:302-1975(-)
MPERETPTAAAGAAAGSSRSGTGCDMSARASCKLDKAGERPSALSTAGTLPASEATRADADAHGSAGGDVDCSALAEFAAPKPGSAAELEAGSALARDGGTPGNPMDELTSPLHVWIVSTISELNDVRGENSRPKLSLPPPVTVGVADATAGTALLAPASNPNCNLEGVEPSSRCGMTTATEPSLCTHALQFNEEDEKPSAGTEPEPQDRIAGSDNRIDCAGDCFAAAAEGAICCRGGSAAGTGSNSSLAGGMRSVGIGSLGSGKAVAGRGNGRDKSLPTTACSSAAAGALASGSKAASAAGGDAGDGGSARDSRRALPRPRPRCVASTLPSSRLRCGLSRVLSRPPPRPRAERSASRPLGRSRAAAGAAEAMPDSAVGAATSAWMGGFCGRRGGPPPAGEAATSALGSTADKCSVQSLGLAHALKTGCLADEKGLAGGGSVAGAAAATDSTGVVPLAIRATASVGTGCLFVWAWASERGVRSCACCPSRPRPRLRPRAPSELPRPRDSVRDEPRPSGRRPVSPFPLTSSPFRPPSLSGSARFFCFAPPFFHGSAVP